MTQNFRLPDRGRIDRDVPVNFAFNGRRYQGYRGDTLASALLANGVRLVGRSFKYHRPRGIMAAGSEEPNALVQLETGGRTRSAAVGSTRWSCRDVQSSTETPFARTSATRASTSCSCCTLGTWSRRISASACSSTSFDRASPSPTRFASARVVIRPYPRRPRGSSRCEFQPSAATQP
mgnify:CR=1 FL=1